MRISNNIYKVIKRFNPSEVEVSDVFNRKYRLSAPSATYSVGDSVLVTNGVIVRKEKKQTIKTFEV